MSYLTCLRDQVVHQLRLPLQLWGKLCELSCVAGEVVQIVLAVPLLPLAPLLALVGYFDERKRREYFEDDYV